VLGWIWRLLRRLRPSVKVSAPPCVRCGGTGLEPTLEEVACLVCDGSGDLYGGSTIRVRLTPEMLLRVAFGEFRRGPA
jgi:DnaJ-class molecular chaperone